jgi:hypothetical protein
VLRVVIVGGVVVADGRAVVLAEDGAVFVAAVFQIGQLELG